MSHDPGPALNPLPLDGFTTDKAFRAALKLHVYATVHDGLFATLLGGRSLVLDRALRLEVGRFTARKAIHLLVGENGRRAATSAEFYGFTSHKVREKLAALRAAGVVDLVGKGVRDAHTYRWRPPLRHWEVCSFERLRAATGGELSLGLELSRVLLERGAEAWTPRDFVDLYARAHAAEWGATRWGARKWDRIASSYSYGEFVRQRLQRLVDAGLVRQEGGACRVAPAGRDAASHFDLFVGGAAFRPTRGMCEACPLDALCLAGSTQRVLAGLNAA